MGLNASKVENTIPVETNTAIIPTIPQDVIDEILAHLAAETGGRARALASSTLKACALVSKPWVQSCQRHLFRVVKFTSGNVNGWFEAFPVPEESPGRHVRDLHVWLGGEDGVPENLFEFVRWFSNVEKISLMGYRGDPSLRSPSLWRLPPSITTLAVDTDAITLVQVRDVIAQLPNLDNLTLSGTLAAVDRRELPGIGTALRGRFCGKIALRDGCVHEDVINMLLEIPSGLRFTEVWIHCTGDRLPSVVRLVEACGKALVKLSHMVIFFGCGTFERSFDFSKLPNLQEASFGFRIGWKEEGVPWIPAALSTFRPATSPCLSAIQLDFASCYIANPSVETLARSTSNDLRWIADEVARIELEFEGAVNIVVSRDPKFKVILETLNIFQHHGQ